jgi:hypothetical protein
LSGRKPHSPERTAKPLPAPPPPQNTTEKSWTRSAPTTAPGMPPPSEASPYASRNHLLSSQRAHADQPAAQPTPPVLPPIRMAAAEASELQQQQQISGNRRSPAASYTEAISQCSSSGRSDPPPIPCPEAPDAKSAVGNRTDWAGRVLGPARGVGLLGDAGIGGAERSEGWVVAVAEEWGIWRRGRQVPVPSPVPLPLPLPPLPRQRRWPPPSFCLWFFSAVSL